MHYACLLLPLLLFVTTSQSVYVIETDSAKAAFLLHLS